MLNNIDIKESSFCELTQEELKAKYDTLSKQPIDRVCKEISLIIISLICKIYNYTFDTHDLSLFNMFMNQKSINASNNEAYFSFLAYSVIKNLENKQLHCLFLNDFNAKKYFEKSLKLYTFLGIGASCNTNKDINIGTKTQIYSNNIIFSNWKSVVFDKLDILNASKLTDRFNLKFDQAFIFDIDRIIYDYEKINLKIKSKNLNPNEINTKDFFKTYKDIIGVSSTLFFESKKIEKSYNIKVNSLNDSKEILKTLKNVKNYFFSTREEKIDFLSEKIKTLSKNNETVIIDVDSKEDLEILKEYLNSKKINYTLFDDNPEINERNLLSIVTPNKINLMTNLTSADIEVKLGGNWEEMAYFEVSKNNIDKNSNYYKEKLKKELLSQENIYKNNIKEIKEKGGINILFTSHYTELKLEYAILKNYEKIPIKEIAFYNCPKDEIYKTFKLDKNKIFNKPKGKDNAFLFNIFSNYIFYLRRYFINKLLVHEKGMLIYYIDDNSQNINQTKQIKIKRNEPCPCGSGLKYKNCCGK